MNKNRNLYKSTQIKHLILLEGQKERIANLLSRFFNAYNKDFYEILKQDEVNSKKITKFNSLFNDIFKNFKKKYNEEIFNLAKFESEFQFNLMQKFSDEKDLFGLTDELIYKIINDKTVMGDFIDDFIENQKINMTYKARQQFNIGLAAGETTDDLAKRLEKNVLNITARNATILARTAVTSVLNETKHEVYKKNKVKKYQYVAIIDSRTTDICIELDGKIFDIDDKDAPRPPQHYQCRSSTIPIFVEEDEIKQNFKKWADENDVKTDKNGNYIFDVNTVQSLKNLIKKEKETLKKA